MAAIDDILGGSGSPMSRKSLQVAPPPIDPSLQGAPNTVGSKPVPPSSQPAPKTSTPPQSKAPGVDATKVVGNPGEAPQPTEKPQMSYVEMYEMMNPNKPETAEERAKREKREKGEAILSAVGDGISALSNLFFTSRYSPNAYDPSKGMSATTKERWDRLRQEREANRRAYSDGYMRAMAMDEAKDREDRNWRHTIEREKIADERYEVKEARDKALADLNEQLKRHQISEAGYKEEQARIKALFAEENEKLDLGYKQAGIQQRNAAAGASRANATASYARANYYNNGGGSGGKHGPTLQLEDDDPMQFGDDKDYDRTVMRLAPDYGVPTTAEVKTDKIVTAGPNRGKPIYRTVKRDVKDIAADIEREAAKRKKAKQSKKPNPMDGEEKKPANGKKQNPMS